MVVTGDRRDAVEGPYFGRHARALYLVLSEAELAELIVPERDDSSVF